MINLSADLLVFEKNKVPTEPIEFLKWFYKKSKWESDRDYYDIEGTSENLINFFMEIKKEYPEMNGPYALSDEEIINHPELESKLTDYTIDEDLIYMGFSWSVSEKAYESVQALAYKYNLGFFDMFNLYLDKDTIIEIPQISHEEFEKRVSLTDKKSFLLRLFKK